MTSPPSLSPAPELSQSPAQSGQRRSSRTALALGLLTFAALAVWTGVRIHESLEARAAHALEKPQAAEKAASSEAEPISLVRGKADSLRRAIACEGTLFPASEVDLAFKASGRLERLRVEVGQLVKKGEVLATLETDEAAAQARAAEAQVRAAEAQLALAEDAESRTTGMVDKGALPQATGVQVEKQRALALAQLDAAKAQLELARANLRNHTLTAPFTAFVTRVPSGTGAIAAAGMPLFHLSDVTTLKLKGTVGEQDAPHLEVGSEIEVSAQGRKVSGKVVAVLAAVDPMTRRVPFEAEIPNDGEPRLLAGTIARAKALAKDETPALRLPQSVIVPGSLDEIMVVSEGKASPRRVELERADNGEILVLSGLRVDEDVVLAPSSNELGSVELAGEPK